LLVSLERLYAVLFPFRYFQLNKEACFFLCMFALVFTPAFATLFGGMIYVFTKLKNDPVLSGLCFPSIVINTDYGGYIFMSHVTLGMIFSLIQWKIL